jgi:hypothetical protein
MEETTIDGSRAYHSGQGGVRGRRASTEEKGWRLKHATVRTTVGDRDVQLLHPVMADEAADPVRSPVGEALIHVGSRKEEKVIVVGVAIVVIFGSSAVGEVDLRVLGLSTHDQCTLAGNRLPVSGLVSAPDELKVIVRIRACICVGVRIRGK